MIRLAAILLMFGFVSDCVAAAHSVAKITCYFMDWDVLTRVTKKADDIRKYPDAIFRFEDSTEVAAFLAMLKLEDLKTETDLRPIEEDARLTIDITSADGRLTTYYASRFSLCTRDSIAKRPSDEAFREKIRWYVTRSKKEANKITTDNDGAAPHRV